MLQTHTALHRARGDARRRSDANGSSHDAEQAEFVSARGVDIGSALFVALHPHGNSAMNPKQAKGREGKTQSQHSEADKPQKTTSPDEIRNTRNYTGKKQQSQDQHASRRHLEDFFAVKHDIGHRLQNAHGD